MKVQGTHTFNAPHDVVWPMLQDPDVLASVMPGCEKLEQVGDNQYTGIIKIKVGPVQGKFNGDITLSNIQSPASYDISVSGKGGPGFVKGDGSLRLEADNGATVLHYTGDAQVGGRLASVGQRLLDTTAKAIIRQSLDGLEQQIQARMAPAPAAEDEPPDEAPKAPPPAAPSQMEFAAGVAKNLFDDYVPPEERPQFFAQLGAVVGGILLFLLFSEWWSNRLADKVARRLQG